MKNQIYKKKKKWKNEEKNRIPYKTHTRQTLAQEKQEKKRSPLPNKNSHSFPPQGHNQRSLQKINHNMK